MTPRKDYHAPMHTAEHILNQTMVRLYNCERSFSNHIERKKSKCDYHFNHNLSIAEIQKINEQVNAVISSELNVNEELLSFKIASEKYNLDKIPGEAHETIRVIHVGDYDSCPCIGKHVKNTREIGEFKITTTSFNNGVLRIRYKLLSSSQ